ncbi:hypothetical protein C8Q80DRAFT_1269545 [Daedaleopsis nitida]|nr:hypothetical protein C8Q80DRAFT_1269545 [Daedaleopsis nitida]
MSCAGSTHFLLNQARECRNQLNSRLPPVTLNAGAFSLIRQFSTPIVLYPRGVDHITFCNHAATTITSPRAQPLSTDYLQVSLFSISSVYHTPAQEHGNAYAPYGAGAGPPKPVQSDFTSAEQRQAALRARGLVPATSAVQNRFRNADGFMMTLSEQEAEIDRRYTVAPGPPSSDDHSDSEATRIREAWLAKQTQASSPECEHTHEEASRKSDAMVRASKDGTVGDRSPIRATFVQVTTRTPTHGDVGEGTLATVEDFRTAPNPRQSADHASPLRSTSGSPEDETSPPVAVSLAGAARPRKEKPPPITVTSHRMSQEARAQQSITVAISAPSDTSTSDGRPQLEQRGRPTAGLHATSPPLGQASSTSSSDGARSRTTTVPALSPTRTVSSGADSSLPTPTTTSCFLGDSSVSHGSTSHSSDNGHETVHRPRRVVDELKAKRRTSGAGAVIMEEYSETDPSSEDGEFGMAVHASPTQETGAAAATAPRMRALDQSAAKQNNRKSFSLFGKKSLDGDADGIVDAEPATRVHLGQTEAQLDGWGYFTFRRERRGRYGEEVV